MPLRRATPVAAALQAAALAAATLIAPVDASAQSSEAQTESEPSEPLVSADNPGFTNVTQPGPKLRLITEQSVGLAFPDAGTTLTLPQVLGRLGLTKFLELRAFLPSAVVQFPEAANTAVDVDHTGFGVLAGGLIAPNVGASVSPVVFIPIGDDGVGVQAVQGSVQGNLSWAITDRVAFDVGALGGWVQVPDASGDLEARGHFLGGALVSVYPVPVVSLYAESYADCVGGAGCEPVIGGGAAWWILPPLQVHVAANTGISDGSPAPAVSLGSVVRWW